MTPAPEQIATGKPYQVDHDYRMKGKAVHGGYFDVPLVQHVYDTPEGGSLWQGGCIHGVPLSGDFDFVLSLYRWERYDLAPTTHRMEVTMYDALDQATDAADGLADIVVGRLNRGQQVLIHCQAGLNRSGLVTATTLVKLGIKPDDAIDLLRAKRTEQVLCNASFEEAIRNLEVPA